MTRYYVKPHFGEWNEVGKEQFDEFVAFLRENIATRNKEEIIARRTRIETDATTPGGAV